MSDIQIDHEAAKSLAERQVKLLPCGWSSVNLSRALIDLHAQLAAERARVEALAELVKQAYMETNKKWQLDETGKWNEQLEQAFKEMFSVTDANKQLTAILNAQGDEGCTPA